MMIFEWFERLFETVTSTMGESLVDHQASDKLLKIDNQQELDLLDTSLNVDDISIFMASSPSNVNMSRQFVEVAEPVSSINNKSYCTNLLITSSVTSAENLQEPLQADPINVAALPSIDDGLYLDDYYYTIINRSDEYLSFIHQLASNEC